MIGPPRNFTVELIRTEPVLVTPPTSPVAPEDITDRVLLDGFGTINRAVERNLLSFRLGDATLVVDNADGYFDDVFRLFGPTDKWMLRVGRGTSTQFLGIVQGRGSIRYDRTMRNVEITAYGPAKVLDESDASNVKRTFGTLSINGVHGAGTTTVTLTGGTTGMMPGDVLHVRSQSNLNTEDWTILYVISATQVFISPASTKAFTTNDPVEVKTPYYRFKSIETLVRLLAAEAKLPVQRYLTTRSQFGVAAPTPLSPLGLGTSALLASAACERNGRMYSILTGSGSWYQPIGQPDATWVQEDATLRPWMDWSRYRRQDAGPPTIILRHPSNVGTGPPEDEWRAPIDDRDPLTKFMYKAIVVAGPAMQAQRRSTTDGTTWGAYANVGTPSTTLTTGETATLLGDFDQNRGHFMVQMDGNGSHWLYDVALNVWTRLDSVNTLIGNVATGCRWIPELDYFLLTWRSGGVGADTHVTAVRDGKILYDRTPFPKYLRAMGDPIAAGARYINGRVYMTATHDGACVIASSDDHWVTTAVKKVVPDSVASTVANPSRVNDSYIMFLHGTVAGTTAVNTPDRRYHIAAPFYAGVVAYADFENKSVGEALSDLAALTNSVFMVDESLQFHFVARDLVSDGHEVRAVDDRVLQRNTTHTWDEVAQFARASGNDLEQVAGDAAYAAHGIELSIDLIPNEAFAHALALALYDFYSTQRTAEEVVLQLDDDHVYQILDRVTLGPSRFMVYESDHDLANDEVTLLLLEDV